MVPKQSRQLSKPEAHGSLLNDELDSLKRKELTTYDVKAVRRKIAEVKGEIMTLIGKLRQDSFGPCASIQHDIDQLLFTVSIHLKEMFDREAKVLQQGVHVALCNVVGGFQSGLSMPVRLWLAV